MISGGSGVNPLGLDEIDPCGGSLSICEGKQGIYGNAPIIAMRGVWVGS